METFDLLLAIVYGALFVLVLNYGVKFISWVARRLRATIPTRYKPADKPEDEHIQILVLGDIGRSPRMQYHALSILRHGRKVDLVGYKESARHPDLIGNPNVTVYPLTPLPDWIDWAQSMFLRYPLKMFQQFWTLFYTLMYAAPPAQWIIVQNPPSIPTFHVALLVSVLRGSKVIVDWHNYGHTLFIRALAPFYRLYETRFGRWLGTEHLAVTDAMARQLAQKPFRIARPVHTLHDRPAAIFQPVASAKERKEFLARLPETRDDAQNIVDGAVRLVVSSTSWTSDEDFGMFLDALMAYAVPDAATADDDDSASHGPTSPLLVIITGKGPQKKPYLDKIKELNAANRLPGVRILTAWLSNRDYAKLLACADLGISLHKSSSGVDLPMKVVDMFGAGLPVAAYSAFESFRELVKEGENGCGFETTAQLTGVLRRLLGMSGEEELARLKKGAIKEGGLRWDEEWDRVVAKVIGLGDTKKKGKK